MSDGRPTASITLSEPETGPMVVELLGDLDIVGAQQIQADLDALVEAQSGRIVFDLGGLDFMDSSGIALLLRAASRYGPLDVRRPSPIIRRVIEATGLSEILRVEPERG